MMYLFYKFLGYSSNKYRKNHTEAAKCIQNHFREYKNKKEENRKLLIKSMTNRISNSYNTIYIDKHGSTLVLRDELPDNDTDSDWNEDNLFFNKERKRIKSNV